MYGSHDMRHIIFRRLTVVKGTPGFGASQLKSLTLKRVFMVSLQDLSCFSLLNKCLTQFFLKCILINP